jgi:hypothetical protein
VYGALTSRWDGGEQLAFYKALDHRWHDWTTVITDVIHRARTQVDLQARAHYAQQIRAWRTTTVHSALEDELSD